MNHGNHEGTEPGVMVVDDDPYLLAAIHQTLTMHGYGADGFDKPADALTALDSSRYLAVIADVKMPGISGLDLLQRIRAVDRDLPVIMITGHGHVDMAVKAMKNGAYDFLEKPVDEDVLLASLARAVEKMRLVLDNRLLQKRLAGARGERVGFYSLIGGHPLMQRLYDTIEIVAREEDPVLISGETGTGKELVARAIHDLSKRRDRPFIAVNMGAIPSEMLEAELFGHEKGAFTGAVRTKIGKFEFAEKGTLFLDEICSLPVNLQAKLLRVLEDRSFARLGANETVPVQARIIAATNSDLAKEIESGRFRQDLYFRLNVLPIRTPALREHKSDIPLLVAHFCNEFNPGCDRDREFPSPAVLNRLQNHDWRGNVRELKNYARRLCIYGEEALDADGKGEQDGISDREPPAIVPLRRVVDEAERSHIIAALQFCNGHVVEACKALNVSRKCLYDKINKHHIDLALLRKE